MKRIYRDIIVISWNLALGKTVHELNVEHCDFYCEKTQFSMLTSAMESYLDKHAHLESVILFGIEVASVILNIWSMPIS